MIYSIVGCGKFGKYHLKTLLELGKEVEYICNSTDSKFPELKEYINLVFPNYSGKIKFTTNLKDILSSKKTEAVAVATGPETHLDIVSQLLESGKNIICEKPFTLSHKHAKSLTTLADSKKLRIYIHYSPLYIPHLEYLNSIPDGNGLILKYTNCGNGPTRSYSGIYDYGSHALSLLAFIILSNKSLKENFNSLKFNIISQPFAVERVNQNVRLINDRFNLNIEYGNSSFARIHSLQYSLVKDGKAKFISEDLSKYKTLETLYKAFEIYDKNSDIAWMHNLIDVTTYYCDTLNSYITDNINK